MTETTDLYAAPGSDLEQLRRLLEEKLQAHFDLHESSRRGGDYYRGYGHGNETFILQRNLLGNSEVAEEGDRLTGNETAEILKIE